MSNKVETPQDVLLHKRWSNPEKEGLTLQSDKMGHADISGWARGVSKPFGSPFKPKRPEVGPIKREFNPITNLRNCVQIEPKPIPHNPLDVCFPGDNINDPRTDGSRIVKTVEVRERLDKHFARCIKRRSKRVLATIPKSEPVKSCLDDCPKADVSAIKPATIEREPEKYDYEDPFRLRYAKTR